MKIKTILLLFLILVINTISAQITTMDFGKQFEHEIDIPNANSLVSKISLQKLKSNYYKSYYLTNDTDENNWIDSRDIKITSITGIKYKLVIPPLKPNAFYRIKYEYFGNDNLYAVMKMLHEDDLNWETSDKNWMKSFRNVSIKYDPYLLTYRPNKREIKEYFKIIEGINLTGTLNQQTKTDLLTKTKQFFKNLKINNPNIDVDKVVVYAKFVKGLNLENISETDIDMFEQTVGSYYDYISFHSLYEKYFKSYFENNSFISTNYIKFFNEKIEEEKKSYTGGDDLPNTLKNIDAQIHNGYKSFSTFAESFKTAYERVIVPDFGYIIYVSEKNNFNGGSPFVGVNISLSPVNKNIPMQISTLSLWQRLSIHTGITINKLAENKKREDLFKENSLLLGLGYKIFNHSYRINFGGVLYKSLDPITGSKSFAIQPYVGLSIDFEIRKWLSQLVPALKL